MPIYFKVDSIIDNSISKLSLEASRLEWYEMVEGTYHAAVETALAFHDSSGRMEYLSFAQQFSSRAKSRVLQKHLLESSNLEVILNTQELAKRKELLDHLTNVKSSIEFSSDSIQDSLTQSYAKALSEWSVFNESLNAKYDIYARQINAYSSTITYQDIQRNLDDDQVIVDYYFTDHKLYSFWISSRDFFYLEDSLSDEVLQEVTHFMLACSTPDSIFPKGKAYDIYQFLLAEGIDRLPDVTELIIIPDGALYNLSFDVLVRSPGGKYLLEDFLIRYHYSTGLYQPEKKINGQIQYVGFGTNYSKQLSNNLKQKTFLDNFSLGHFIYADDEIKQSSRIFNGKMFIGREASLAHFFEEIGHADILHLSLHGIVNKDNSSKSCIIFDDLGDNILLTPLSLQSEKLNSGLIFLSSCNSASGQNYQGEGVQGMSRVFLYTGAKAVLSSLWSATERSSLELSKNLFRQIKSGLPVGQALRHAKISYLNNASPSLAHPYYWANFILIGNPVRFAAIQKTTILLGILLFVILLLVMWRLIRIYN